MSGNAPSPVPAPAPEGTPTPQATMPEATTSPGGIHRPKGVSAGVWAGLARFWDAVGAVRAGNGGDKGEQPTAPPAKPPSPTPPTSPRMALFNPFARSPPPTPISPEPPAAVAPTEPEAPTTADDAVVDANAEPLPADTLPPFHAHKSLPCAALLEQHRDDALPALLGDIAAVQELCARARQGAPGGEFGAFGTRSGYQAELRNLERTARSLGHLAAGVETQLRMLRGLPPCTAVSDDALEADGGAGGLHFGEGVEAYIVAVDGDEVAAESGEAAAVPTGEDGVAIPPHDEGGSEPVEAGPSDPPSAPPVVAVDEPASETTAATTTTSVDSPAEAPAATPTSTPA